MNRDSANSSIGGGGAEFRINRTENSSSQTRGSHEDITIYIGDDVHRTYVGQINSGDILLPRSRINPLRWISEAFAKICSTRDLYAYSNVFSFSSQPISIRA